MSSRNLRQRLTDVIENADRISGYLAGLDGQTFASDHKTIDAAERCLERIAEAVPKIGAEQIAVIAPAESFERLRGLGNLLRHGYDEIDLGLLFNLLRDWLPPLRDAAARALDAK